MGLLDTWLVYADAVGASAQWRAEPAWLEAHLDLAVEPGFFLKRPPGTPTGPGADGTLGLGDRDFGWRAAATGQINVNLQGPRWWLYSRTTGVARHRAGFVEEDTFADMRIGRELSIEQATAVLRRVAGTELAGWWVYAEHTVGGVDGVGVRPHRISAGVVTASWPAPGASLNLDVFYSVAPPPLDGPGAIFSWAVRWPP